MPKVEVQHNVKMSAADTMAKIKVFFETDDTIRKIDPNIKCTFNEAEMTGKVVGSQFKADVLVKTQGETSNVVVIVDLPFLLSPFKGKVKETIERKLAKYLA